MRPRTRLALLLLAPVGLFALLSPSPARGPVYYNPASMRLPTPAFVRLGEKPLHFDGGVYRTAHFPDGDRFLAVTPRAMHIIDVRTRAVLKTLPVGYPEANFVGVSPDGKRIVYGDKQLRVIDAETGARLGGIRPHNGAVQSIEFSPDGRLLLTSGSEVNWDQELGRGDGPTPAVIIHPRSSCKVWDAATLTEHPATRGGLIGESPVWHPNGREFVYRAVVGDIWKEKTESRVHPLDGRPPESFALRVAAGGKEYRHSGFTPSGRLVLAHAGPDVAVFDWPARTLRLDLPAEKQPLQTWSRACIAPDDDTVYTTDGKGVILVRSLSTGTARAFARFFEQGSYMWLRRDGKVLFTHAGEQLGATTPNLPVAWDVTTGRKLDTHAGHRGDVYAADISPDGRFVLTGGIDLTARVWDRETGRELRVFERHTAPVHLVSFLADNRTAVSLDAGGAVKVWDTQTGEESRALALGAKRGEWSGMAVSPGGDLLAIGFEDRVRFWTLPELAERDLIPVPFRKSAGLRFTPDGRALDFRHLYPGGDGMKWYHSGFRRWDVLAGREYFRAEMSPWVQLASPDGATFAGFVMSDPYRLVAWDRVSGRELARLGSTGLGTAKAFSPDGTRLLVTDVRDTHTWDRNFTLYDTRTWRPVAAPLGHAKAVHAAAFSRDGRFLVTSGADGTAIVSDLATVPAE